ncbi:MAG: ABC-2 family transporter protein [Candidatus Hermodarchaeota archaeon]|nr:ABC-2 family transporter protein [Candidatus Hermodarchaeota archaeon]
MTQKDFLRQLSLIPSYLRLSLLRLGENKVQLWGAFITSMLSFIFYAVFWNVMTLQVPILTGVGWVVWGAGELTFLVGMTNFAWSFGAWFWMGIWEIHWYITELGIEEYQIRPVNSILQIVAQNFWAGWLIQMSVGIVMLVLSVVHFGLVITPVGIILGLIALLLGQAALYILWATLACLSFWIGRNAGLIELSDAIEWNFARMPIDVMPHLVQHFLTFILPVIFISTVPTMMMLGQLPLIPTLLYLGIAGLLVLVWIFIFNATWQAGLRRYQPVGG